MVVVGGQAGVLPSGSAFDTIYVEGVVDVTGFSAPSSGSPPLGAASPPAALQQRRVIELEHQVEGLSVAVRSRDVIGQAKGVLVSHFAMSADDAFVLLEVGLEYITFSDGAFSRDGRWAQGPAPDGTGQLSAVTGPCPVDGSVEPARADPRLFATATSDLEHDGPRIDDQPGT